MTVADFNNRLIKMKPVFLELQFDSKDCLEVGIESRDEIEDDFEEVLEKSGLGAVTGGGGGMGVYNIDVDLFDETKLQDAISVIRKFLISLNVPRSSKIVRHTPQREEFSVYV